MSGYEQKNQEQSAYDYAATEAGQVQSYAGFVPPSFDLQFPNTQADQPHALASRDQMPFLDPPFQPPRDTSYQTSPNPIIPASSRTSPSINSAGAFRGRAGEIFRINHNSRNNFDLQHTRFALLFGNTYCNATVTERSQHGDIYVYTLAADIPPLDTTSSAANKIMPLLLDISNDHGTKLEFENYGTFEYALPPSFQPYPQFSTQIESRKRKLEQETSFYTQPLSKRAASQPIRPRHTSSEISPSVQAPLGGTSQYFDPNIRYALPSGNYDRPAAQPRGYSSFTPTDSYGYGTTNPPLQHHKVRSPPMASPSSYTAVRPSGNRRISKTPRVASAHVRGSLGNTMQPTLVRTSLLQQGGAARAASPTFNPYANYPDGKAELVLEGDLMSMIRDWLPEEREAHRRLVEFSRSQSGSVVKASFKAVLPEERTQNSACISCIWWEEQDSYYVTSVDTIALLESLIAARFTVEEKNRIRRNLEALKPDTISKIKPETDSFFRLIMSFPNPKPRNIEKDVKVFAWGDLEKALGKIFGKYSASFSSTASHLLPAGQTSAATDATVDQRPTASPRSTTGSTASISHASSMTSTALSPSITGSAGQAQHGMVQEAVGTPFSPRAMPAATSAQEYRPSSMGMPPYISGQSYGPYMAQYSPATPYPLGLTTARPSYSMTPYLGQSTASTSGYARPLEYYQAEQAVEPMATTAAKTSYPAYQPTTSG